MGLDTKTSSAKHRKGKISEKREELENDMKLSKDREYLIPRRNEMKGKKISMSTIFSAQEIKMGVRDVRTAIEEMEQKRKSVEDVWEDYQENTFKYGNQEHRAVLLWLLLFCLNLKCDYQNMQQCCYLGAFLATLLKVKNSDLLFLLFACSPSLPACLEAHLNPKGSRVLLGVELRRGSRVWICVSQRLY